MTEKTLKSVMHGHPLTLVWGGERDTYADEVLVEAHSAPAFYNGPALRDALIEAFPLPEPDLKVKQYGRVLHETEKPKPEVVPGMVFKDDPRRLRVVLPNESWHVIDTGKTWSDKDFEPFIAPSPWVHGDTLVFDPRNAKALPSPLGVRVGDSVRRVQKGDHTTVTTEFQVNHIDRQIGYAYPKYGLGHPVDELEVTSREVPDRLPAGTIVRLTYDGDLRLVTNEGGIHLTGYVNANPAFRDGSDYGRLVEDREAEVIYLPES